MITLKFLNEKPHFKRKTWLVRQDSDNLDPAETVECICITSFLLDILLSAWQ